MRLLTIVRDGRPEPAVQFDDQTVGLHGSGFDSVMSLITGGADARDGVMRWVERHPGSADVDLGKVTYHSPIPRPPKIICIGLNYRDHAEESKLPIPDVPTVFCKFPTAVTGHNQPVVLPKNSVKPDYEAEFAVVIGPGGRHIAEQDWQKHVFGYTILNDVSARDYQMATSQWMIGKTFDTFAPIGPAVVTADEIEDPHNLNISLSLNGEVMQNSNTRNLIFRIPQLIAHLSSVFTLEPGDIIATGTPAGVGFARKPPRWLRPGDDMLTTIEGLGELHNPIVAEV
ncbi:MAG: fumarylacetoacetate hydrolase family protein [Candidatus Sulfopaludibacter sp.]|nr:fumarylacetoacetate hydrolase family protein [Candidatus Sulfopaludibacter sp.]